VGRSYTAAMGLKGGKVALTVTVQNDAYPDDTEFEVMGLGLFTNGESREVTEDQEKLFVSMNQAAVEETIGENENVAISGATTIENMDEVLGTDVSDTIPAPEVEAPPEETPAAPDEPPVGNVEVINPPEGGVN
jgi:hypothetical protein